MWNRATPCWKGAATPAGRRALQGAGRRGCRGEKMPSEVICSRGLGPREPTLQAGGSRARAQGEAAPPVRAATKNRGGNKRENGGRPRKGREGGRPPSSRPQSPFAHPTPPLWEDRALELWGWSNTCGHRADPRAGRRNVAVARLRPDGLGSKNASQVERNVEIAPNRGDHSGPSPTTDRGISEGKTKIKIGRAPFCSWSELNTRVSIRPC